MIGPGRATNPFSAARFVPGRIPWLARDPQHLDRLAARALAPGAQHQVVGVHGSGKSTLLAHLESVARRHGMTVVRFRGSRGVPMHALARVALRGPRVVLVDEVEELAPFAFTLVRAFAASLDASLVGSAHRDLGLPTLLHARVGAETAARVVAHLAPEASFPGGFEERLARHGGNLREVLFELYDELEAGTSAEDRVR